MVGTYRSSPPHPLTLGCAFVKFQTHAEAQAAINTLHSSRTLPVSPSPLLPCLSLPLAHLPGPGTEHTSIQDRTCNELSQKNQRIKYHTPIAAALL